ncbi:vanillyl-alcohol oxidase [Jaapia argillacea MUCL 33604]|uniref:Vanillyl-alcohol oxidase n=1 Tax=Jaapia argillacea MUCL 33604 TaxID=933084 RepID=A0A067Q6E8_9AGAM|nr:vanillyl-alcohol oxidase [Jaapia argillacea MUCL 33604]
MAPFVSTAVPEGRPKKIDRPPWHGSCLGQHETSPWFEESLRLAKESPRKIPIPPGHTAQSLEVALRDLAEILGQQWVKFNDVPLIDGDYHAVPLSHDSYHILDPDDLVPSAVCWPADTEDVVKTVKWANKWKVPIWPISVGRNLGYGGSAPRVRGSLVLDLGRRMDRILSVDTENAVCLIEPGVQYVTLYEHLQEIGVGNDLWVDVPDLPGGSVMGNALERGVGYTPYGDHWAHHIGLEVVTPTGEVIRTGMGSMEGSECWQLFPYGYGPHQDGIFSQSNYGIVTKMGMELLPNPGGVRVFMAAFPRREDLYQAIEIIRPLMIKKIIGNVPMFRLGLQDASLYKTRDDFELDERGIVKPDSLKKVIEELKTGEWVFYAVVYGPDEITQAKYEYVKKQLGQINGTKFYQREDVPPEHYLHNYAHYTTGIPTWRELDRMKWVPNASHMFFAPVSANSGQDAERQSNMCKKRMEEYGFNCLDTFFIGTRAMHHVISFMYNRKDAEERTRALACIRALIDDCAKLGIGEYRTHLALQDQVAKTYNWNDGAIMKFNEKIKDALDPNGILQPGRSGIWPKEYRGKGFELWGGERRSASTESEAEISFGSLA